MRMISGGNGRKLIGFPESVMVVDCKECGRQHTPDEVQTINIEEDAEGRDVITYECPVTNSTTTSVVFLVNQ